MYNKLVGRRPGRGSPFVIYLERRAINVSSTPCRQNTGQPLKFHTCHWDDLLEYQTVNSTLTSEHHRWPDVKAFWGNSQQPLLCNVTHYNYVFELLLDRITIDCFYSYVWLEKDSDDYCKYLKNSLSIFADFMVISLVNLSSSILNSSLSQNA